jgi:hypothetical protein
MTMSKRSPKMPLCTARFPQDLVIIAEQLRKQKDAAMAHQEGMKMSIKRYKAMV